ncbi:MAG: DUF5688 family protein [Clostridiales bacterium]|nr:DUF5688 family protein [Clostridiales bacterium]
MVTERKTAPGRLSFNEFMEAFRAQYKYGASQSLKKYSITEQIIHKNNRNLHGIIVRAPGNRIAPVFYYEDFYEAYRTGTSIDECIGKMVRFVSKNKFPDNALSDMFTNWEKVKDMLIIKLMNYNKNKKDILQRPYMIIGDMVAIVQIFVDDPTIGNGCVSVDNALLEMWSVGREELFKNAFENMNRFRIKAINLQDLRFDEEEEKTDEPNIFVVSYDAPFPGAAVLLRAEYLGDFAKAKDMDFFVLPVSVHEILLIEKRPQIGQEHLFSMMQAINSDTALSENMLSERIFTIDRNEKTLRYITDGKEVELIH